MHERPLYYVFALFVALMVINLISPAFGDGEVNIEADINFKICANGSDNAMFVNVSNQPAVVNFTAVKVGTLADPEWYNWTIINQSGTGPESGKRYVNYYEHTFTIPGVYVIRCMAYNGTGTSNPLIKDTEPGFVTAYSPLSANFTNSTTTGVLDLKVDFYDNSTGGPTDFSWKLSDGNANQTIKNATTYYSTNGTKTIYHTVWNNSYASSFCPEGNCDPIRSSMSRNIFIDSRQDIIPLFSTNISTFTGQAKGQVPLCLQFYNNSTSDPRDTLYFNWTFGDGNKSTLQDPVNTYYTPRLYPVKLNVTGNWSSNETTRLNYVNAYLPISANFSSSPAGTCTPPVFPVTYSFKTNATKTGYSNPDYYNWSFDDGTSNETDRDTNHVFNLPGIYNVTLTTLNGTHNISASELKKVQITGLYANFTTDKLVGYQTKTGEAVSVNFTRNVTDTFGASLFEYDFGNGDHSILPNDSTTYNKPGVYRVTFTVGNECGRNSTHKNITIIERPVPDFDYAPTFGKFPLSVQFTDKSTDSPDQYLWDFGDGSPRNLTKNPVHQYALPGQYRVELTVKNITGPEIWTRSIPKTIFLSEGFNAKFEAEPTRGGWPLKVQFTDKTEPALVNNWNWSFGDGTENATIQNPNHTYYEAGNFIVNLTVKNTTTQAMGSYQSTIEVVDPIYANFKPNQTYVYMNQTTGVQFESLSIGNVTEYFWDFGDGSEIETDPTVVHIFPQYKEYQVNLTVANDYYNLTDTIGYLLNITPQEYPYIDFVVNPPRADKMEPVSFTVTEIGGTNVSTPVWNFGDGSPEVTGIKPTHQFQKSGIFNVTATVTGDYGPAASTTHPASIRGLDPDFIIVPPGGWATVNTNVTFIDNSVGNPEKWAWDFGDNTIIEQTYDNFVVHKFEKEGINNITMTATNWEPVTESITKQLTIINKTVPQGVDFEIPEQKYSGNSPLYVQFEDTTPAQANVVEWLWEFGDGTNSFEKEPNHTYQKPGQYTVTLTVRNDAGTNEKRRVAYVVVL